MVQFDKLRLSGFKSFVDPTELAIETGMTGIVGPNGCGKSNLVEALKWVMGETSAKQMRGSEMEDVIFAGAGTRPARNIAEVMLTLDNKTRTAPAMVNDTDQLDVMRRIERGQGSAYSVNGREIRARDVQTLFADAATGSRSTALVSQGRIGALINAKAADRRTIIDEAAGITGLYARRHEAELRLRAAEANLARVQDVLVALDEQHKGLKRQARQASRYRNLSDHIRRAEAAVLALKLAKAESELAEAGERLKEAEAQVADLTRLVGLATTAQAEAATALPPLRNDEAAAAAALQRLRVAHDALTAEAERVAAAQKDAETRLAQTEQDLVRERGRKGDAETAIAELAGQRTRLEEERVGEDERAAAAQQARDAAHATTVEAETEHDRLTRQIADDEALRESISREIAELEERLVRLAARREEVVALQRQIEAELGGLPALSEVEAALEAARAAFEGARRDGQGAIDAAREAERYEFDAARQAVANAEAERLDLERAKAGDRETAEASHAAAVEELQNITARLTKLRAEESGVAAALKSAADSLWPPLLDALTVESGFEKALAAAFGEDLEASSDRGAPIHWLPLGALSDAPALPAEAHAARGARQGAGRARAPARLHRHGCRRHDWRRLCRPRSSPASSWSPATARCGVGTATPCAPVPLRRRPPASASATGWRISASRSTRWRSSRRRRRRASMPKRCAWPQRAMPRRRVSSRPAPTSARSPRRRGARARMPARRRAPPSARRRKSSPPPRRSRPKRATVTPTWPAAPTSCAPA